MALLYETLRHPRADSGLLLMTETQSMLIARKVCAGAGTGACQPTTERCCNPPFDVRDAYLGVSNGRERRRRAPRGIRRDMRESAVVLGVPKTAVPDLT